MAHDNLPPEANPFFDAEAWMSGFQHGHHEGRSVGEALGEHSVRDRLLRQLALMACDLKLGLVSDATTPLATVQAVMRLIEERQPEGRDADMTDSELLDKLAEHGLTRDQMRHGLAVVQTGRHGSVAWHFTHGQVQTCDVRVTFPSRTHALRQMEGLIGEMSHDNGLS